MFLIFYNSNSGQPCAGEKTENCSRPQLSHQTMISEDLHVNDKLGNSSRSTRQICKTSYGQNEPTYLSEMDSLTELAGVDDPLTEESAQIVFTDKHLE